jgi:hypothetical protein
MMVSAAFIRSPIRCIFGQLPPASQAMSLIVQGVPEDEGAGVINVLPAKVPPTGCASLSNARTMLFRMFLRNSQSLLF